ncbi:hypothetical protein EYC80_007106 [Monilinia laxa]|uniref:Uncharacterized protein n=1 Tax=Monilinia laxa TaxID=61186 RepID=A0A5N6K086_MONLA|nr:hypothetical protein EYC80_007106 [Monilinia laxa]
MANQTSHNEECYEDLKSRCYSIIPLCFSLLLKKSIDHGFAATSIVGVQEYLDLIPPPEGNGHILDIPHTSLTVHPMLEVGSTAEMHTREGKTCLCAHLVEIKQGTWRRYKVTMLFWR